MMQIIFHHEKWLQIEEGLNISWEPYNILPSPPLKTIWFFFVLFSFLKHTRDSFTNMV